jgi:hypothetical protein
MENHEEEGSLEGKGWDILAGGEGHAAEVGGEDPFDLAPGGRQPSADNPFAGSGGAPAGGETNPFDEPVGASLVSGAANPFDEAADSDVLDSGHGTARPGERGPEAYGDWGRGGERPGPEPTPVASGQPEPRDLSAEDLGYVPGGEPPAAAVAAPRPASGMDDFYAAEGATPAASPVASVPGTTGRPLSDGVEVTVGGELRSSAALDTGDTSRFATPTPVSALEARMQVYDPFTPVGEPPVYGEPGEDLPIDASLGPQLVTPERIDALWDEINTVYEAVIKDVRGYFRSTEDLLADLKKAREYLLSGVESFDNAEVIVKRVKAKLELEEKVRGWSRTVGTWIAVYLVAWLATLVLLVMINKPVVEVFMRLMPPDMAAAYVPAMWGALGGVLGGLWVLIEHTARKRDFDPIHTRWYVLNPFMGMGLGVVMYALFQMGVVFGGIGTGQPSVQAVDITERTPWLLYGLCLVVGFQQNVLWDLLDRLLGFIRNRGDTQEADQAAELDIAFD